MTVRSQIFPAPLRPMLHPALTFGWNKSLVHRAALMLVALTVASGAIVIAEPAPVDALTLSLLVILPVIGMIKVTSGLIVFLSVWLVIAGCHFFAATLSSHFSDSLVFCTVTLYLSIAAFMFAGFIARRPATHTRLVLNAYVAAAVVATLAGLVGYFDAFPGAHELLTKFGRASGTFKDPNVFGAFLILALLYTLHQIINNGGIRQLVAMTLFALLSAGVLLSFSRGAWASAAIGSATYLLLSFLTARYHRQQLKMIVLVVCGGALSIAAVMTAAQSESVGGLLSERAQLSQTYDEGHDGRFGGQRKALNVILNHPFGIGAQEFVPAHHTEEVHNVYLTVFVNAGWLGGFLFLTLVMGTVLLGLRHAFRRTATQHLFIVVFAAFLAIALEGLLIDIDHWRHFYLLMALVWGLMTSDRRILRRPKLIADIPPNRVATPAAGKSLKRQSRIVTQLQSPARPIRIKHNDVHRCALRAPRIMHVRH